MASVTIFVSFNDINSCKSNFSNTSNTVKNVTNTMLQTVSSMNGSWLGAAGSAYIKRFAQLKQDMDEMFRIIEEYVNDLTQILANYQEAESTIQGQVSGLDTDVIDY